ncbi:MAG: FecR domain-containing protein, partial [Terracidiphilus sp.]
MRHWRTWIAVVGLGLFGISAFAADVPNTNYAASYPQPGTLNYVEGQANFDGRALSNKSVGSVELKAGQELTTGAGKAEVLLTPGIFLRLDSNSAVQMISPDLARTQVELERGRAGVEVDQIFPQNMIQIVDNGVTTQLMKTGYYEFSAQPAEAMVFDGQAEVGLGDGRWEKVKGHHEVALVEGTHEKAFDFNAKPTDDALYNWSRLRSQYLAEANNQIAGDYAYEPGFYPGWYWDPYMWDYTYLGSDPFY